MKELNRSSSGQDQQCKLVVQKLPVGNNFVLIQYGGNEFFISSTNSIITSVPMFSGIIKFLVVSGIMDIKVLEGILSELKE